MQSNLKQFAWVPLPKFEQAVPVHTSSAHFYRAPDGRVFSSVTTMLYKVQGGTSPGLQRWRDEIGESVADYITGEAKKNGTATHNIIEKYLNNRPIPELSLLIRGHFSQLKPFLDKIDNISATEIPLYSYSMKLAGMADCIAQYDGVPSIIDFKTSRKQKKEEWIENYFLQATAYSKMWAELTGNKIEQIVILISSEDGATQEFVRKPSDFGGLLSDKLKQFEKMENGKK